MTGECSAEWDWMGETGQFSVAQNWGLTYQSCEQMDQFSSSVRKQEKFFTGPSERFVMQDQVKRQASS